MQEPNLESQNMSHKTSNEQIIDVKTPMTKKTVLSLCVAVFCFVPIVVEIISSGMISKIKNYNSNIFETQPRMANPIANMYKINDSNNTNVNDDRMYNYNYSHILRNDTKNNATVNNIDDKFDFIIIQAWWPEPEQEYVNDIAHYYYTKKSDAKNKIKLKPRDEDTVTRLQKACDRVNKVLRKEYLKRSALFYVGNIKWIKDNVPHCLKFDNIFTYEMKYDDLDYAKKISDKISPDCQTKFGGELETGLFQRYDRIWLNKFNIVLNTTLYAQTILNISNESLINNEHAIVWIDFGFRGNHIGQVKRFLARKEFKNIKYNNNIDRIRAMWYHPARTKIKNSNEQFYFGNQHCNIAPRFVAAFWIMYYNTLKEYRYFYNDTLYQMFNTVQGRHKKGSHDHKANFKYVRRLLNKMCNCFDEEIVIAHTLQRMEKEKKKNNNTNSTFSWTWVPINEKFTG